MPGAIGAAAGVRRSMFGVSDYLNAPCTVHYQDYILYLGKENGYETGEISREQKGIAGSGFKGACAAPAAAAMATGN
jgi:hypothetical protein